MELTLVSSGVVKMEKNRHEDVKNVAWFENEEHELLVDVAHSPEKNQKLLMKVYLLGRAREVGLDQRVVQKASQAFQDEGHVL